MVGKVPFVDDQMIGNVIRMFFCVCISPSLLQKVIALLSVIVFVGPSSFFLFPKVEERVKEEDEVDTRKGKVIKFGWIEGVLMR